MTAFVLAVLAMALKDSVATCLVIAEARGKALLAGGLAAVSDFAGVLVTLAGAGVIIAQGWTVRTAGILAVMMLASFFGTMFWTWAGRRLTAPEEPGSIAEAVEATAALSRRTAALEREVGIGA